MQKVIFIVDDNDTNLLAAENVLEKKYKVFTLPSAAKMFTLLDKLMPDLILLDIEMPEMDGFEAILKLKNNPSWVNIPVIFLTAILDPVIEASGFKLGAVDFITKPFSEPVLLNRVKTHLDIDGIIRQRTEKLLKLQNALVYTLADMVESRDEITGGHIERTSTFIKILVDAIISRGIYYNEISKLNLDLFVVSARLHDTGKIAISDTILNKPGKLTDEEFTKMKTHASMGEQIVEQIITRAEEDEHETFLYHAKLFAGYHHERWDGKGYPHGLAGTDIPIQGRIMAFADVYDALISDRPYKKAFTHEQAVKIIEEGHGTQFDPVITDVFLEVNEIFDCINLKDNECKKLCQKLNMPNQTGINKTCYKEMFI